MAKLITKNSFTQNATPSGLSAGELAVNVTDKKIFIGNAVEGVVTLHDQNNIVTSVNGITGIVGISAGSLINISQSGKTLTISSPDTLYGVSGAIYASNLATGLLHGGIITINAGNSAAFDITAGRGQIHITGATFNADPLPTLQYIDWTAKTGVTLSGLTSSDTTWLYFDNTGTLRQQSTYYTDQQIDENVIIGALVHPTRSYISLAKTIPNVAYATDKQYEQFIRLFGPLKQSGHTISANGANLKLNRSSGSAYILGRNWINDPNNPTIVTDNAQTDCTFWRYYRGATAGTFVTVLNQTAIDPDNYDDGSGTLQTVPSNQQYTIQRLFYFPGTPSVLGVYYGRGTYASMPDAAANIQFEDFTEIDNTKTNAVSVGYIIVKKNTTNLTTAIAADECRIIQSGIFRSTVSGGGSVATKLDDLTDVTISGIVDDHNVLVYDIATSQWLNTPIEHIAVSTFNGRTGAVQGVSAASAGIGISVSGATGAVTITNTGVISFNGVTGDVLVKIEDLDVLTSNRIDNYVLFWDNDNELHEYQSVSTLLGNYVTTVNGATGAITNVAKTNTTQTFTQLQDFSAGISASTSTNVIDVIATTDGCGLRIAQAASGSSSRVGGIQLGRGSSNTANSYIENYVGQLKFFNGISGTNETPGTNMLQLSTTNAIFGVPIAGATFSSTIGQVTIQKSAYSGSDSGYLRIVGADVLNNNQYNSDIRANASSAADTTHTLPAVTGTLLNTASNYVSGICGATGAITLTAGSNMTITKSGNIFTFASSGGGGGSNFTYSSSAPGTPADGDRWMDSDTGKEYIYVNDGTSSQWIEPVSSNGLVGVTYTSATNLLEFGLTATFSGAVTSGGGYRITSNAINAQTGTTYSLLSTDNGKIITMNNGSAITLTVPSGLPIGFNTTVIQLGAGQVGITSASTTLNSFQSKYNLAGQHAAASIISYTTDVFNVAGGLTG